MVICPQCSTPAPNVTSRFCDHCGTALPTADAAPAGPPSYDCEICGRPYKTERGRRAHLAKVHPTDNPTRTDDGAAPWRAEEFATDDVRTPWLPPPEQPPPRPVPGASSADLATQATAAASPPPPDETFRWSQPTPAAAQPVPPQPAPPLPPPPGPQYDYGAGGPPPAAAPDGVPPPGPAYASRGQVGVAEPGSAAGGSAQWLHGPPFRSLKDLSSVIGLLFVIQILVLLTAAGANLFLAITVPPEAGRLDLFLKIDDNQWIAWAVAGVLTSVAYLVIVVWLFRAYRNQLALGLSETGLPPPVVVVMCFVPVVNLVFMNIALREIWRNADLQRNEWAARSRRSSVPNRINMIWIGPVLAVVASVAFAIVVRDRIGADGVTSITDARALYVSRVVLLFEFFWITIAIRRVFGMVTEQQERAHWHYQMGRGPAGPPPPPTAAPSTAFPTVPS